MADDEYEETAELRIMDAAATTLLTRLVECGRYQTIMADLAPEHRAEVEAAVERHAARRRAAGDVGW